MNKKDIFFWGLYDFANSLAYVGFVFYFGLWFVADMGGSDLWISGVVAVSTILLLFTLPILGHLSDRSRRRMPFLTVLSLFCMAAMLGLGFVTGASDTLTLEMTAAVIVMYFLVQYFYQSSFAFYHSFLQDLSTSGISIEKISGFGLAMGQLGNITGLALFLPISLGKISILGLSGKPAIFAAAGLLFFLFFLPTWLYLKDRYDSSSTKSESTDLGSSVKGVVHTLRNIRQYPGVLPYLISYYLFADAVLTLGLFAFLYLEIVGSLDDTAKSIAGGVSVLATMVGALASPAFVRLLQSRKRVISTFLFLWSILLMLLAVAQTGALFMVIIAVNGFVFGVIFALSRAFYSDLVPKEKQAELFSVYVLFERAASVLGPLLWSATAFIFASYGPDKYRFSVFLLALLVALSLIPLRYVPEPEHKKS
jgi:UMF1 family MFS transporter